MQITAWLVLIKGGNVRKVVVTLRASTDKILELIMYGMYVHFRRAVRLPYERAPKVYWHQSHFCGTARMDCFRWLRFSRSKNQSFQCEWAVSTLMRQKRGDNLYVAA
jgi:hypothetical protein